MRQGCEAAGLGAKGGGGRGVHGLRRRKGRGVGITDLVRWGDGPPMGTRNTAWFGWMCLSHLRYVKHESQTERLVLRKKRCLSHPRINALCLLAPCLSVVLSDFPPDMLSVCFD